jgi:hypothetical protein
MDNSQYQMNAELNGFIDSRKIPNIIYYYQKIDKVETLPKFEINKFYLSYGILNF